VKVAGRFHAWLFYTQKPLPRKNILKNSCAVLRRVLHLCNKTTKMKQISTSKTDKTIRIVLILAVVAIALGVTYTWYLHHIKQFGN
jgi:hypothetical protein